MALTTHIKAGFQHQLKTGAVFFNLTAAYDTVWREGLMIKFLEAVPWLKLFNLLKNMLSNHYFQVFLRDQSSKWRRLNNGLPQGSVLAPILFNLYMSDLPSTTDAKVFHYADDIAMTYQAKTFDECENNLEADIELLNQFFHRWCLQPNPGKTEMGAFHLNTHVANNQLVVMFNGTSIKHVDRTLSFKFHLQNAAKKMSSRVNLVRKLADTKWGSNTQTLRTASLALV
jgi:hypothetical protein